MDLVRSDRTTPTYPESLRLEVDRSLESLFPRADELSSDVYEAMRYSLFSGGKRFRPVLCLLVADLLGIERQKIVPAACALEHVHTYSLIHDDLPAIDNDELRRGSPTCHIRFGEATAILAGDALYAEAFYLLTGEAEHFEALRVVEAIKELASASGVRGMVGGQMVDIISEGKDVPEDVLHFIHANKTGKLIRCAAKLPAILSGQDEKVVRSIDVFAAHLGQTFQIIDDVLDVTGDAGLLGKNVGADERSEKTTYPRIYGLEGAKDLARNETQKALAALDELAGLLPLSEPERLYALRAFAEFNFMREN